MKITSSKFNNKHNTLIVIVFCIVISLPLLSTPFIIGSKNTILKNENRLAGSWPSLITLKEDFIEYTRQANRYLNDNFLFRHDLLKYYAQLNYKLLNRATGGQAIIGKDGWLFLSYPSVLENVRGVSRSTELEAQNWASQARIIKETVENNGGQFLVAIVPDKAQVYYEYLPDNIIHQPTRQRAIELAQALNNTDVAYIDLLKPLLDSKKVNDNLIYSKTDSHWSFIGALNGYQSVIKKLNESGQNLPVVEASQLRKVIENNFTGDLANSLNLGLLFSERLPILHTIDNKKKSSLDKKLLLLADSFTRNQLPHFQNSFKDVTCMHHDWGQINLETIKEHKADVVILQIAERGLVNPISVKSVQNRPCFN